MPGADALALLSQSLLVVLTAWKLIELLRHRDRARLDLVLVLAPLALAVGVTWLEERGLWAVVDVPLAPMAFVLHPVMLLRVVDHFRAVPRWVAALMVVSVAASWALLALAPSQGPWLVERPAPVKLAWSSQNKRRPQPQ